MTGRVEHRLAELGITLPPAPIALAAYAPAVQVDGWVYTAGQLPIVAGQLHELGVVGADVTLDAAAECARLCALNGLAAIKSVVGDLDRIDRIVKVTGFVASAAGFTGQPNVLNGASELLVDVFGAAGAHARSAVGVSVLPMNAPVEVELVATCRPTHDTN